MLTHTAAWLAVTGAAVALSWYGVRSVMRDTVFEPPRTPVGAAARESSPTPLPEPPSGPASLPPSPATTTASPSRPDTAPPATTKSFDATGGRATFTFAADSADLIAAVPNPGWAVQVTPGAQSIRVDFTSSGHTSTVTVTWNGHPPAESGTEQ